MSLSNPIPRHQLIVSLRRRRGLLLMLGYVGLLGLTVLLAWPTADRLDLTGSPAEARRLTDLFFLTQYVLMALLVPPLAADAISGERERNTLEMLLATPLRPAAIVWGKFAAGLTQLAVLVFASLPIVTLCLPLGGIHPSEAAATYVAMCGSASLFGMVAVAVSAESRRTMSAMVISYMIILPVAASTVMLYSLSGGPQAGVAASSRLVMLGLVWPVVCGLVCVGLLLRVRGRLLKPLDEMPGGGAVGDLGDEDVEAVGMVIRRDRFPDYLFAPPERDELMADGVNPVHDKEIRGELFGQGTLMLRLTIQVSMLMALPLMAVCFYLQPAWAGWYTGYVVLLNLLLAPVFSAGSITGERERGTLDLLLCTPLSPARILWGKMLAGMRVSFVLTSFVVWPIVFAWALPPWTYGNDGPAMLGYLAIIALSAVTSSVVATFCSLVARRTSLAMLGSYTWLGLMYGLPLLARGVAELIAPPLVDRVWAIAPVSPVATAASLPLWLANRPYEGPEVAGSWFTLAAFLALHAGMCVVLLVVMFRVLAVRWRVRS